MKEASLPSPGIGSQAMHLRRIAVVALNALQMTAPKYPGGAHPNAAQLATFFTTCAASATEFGKTSPVNTVAPAITGTAQLGATLTTTNGTWTGTATITYTRQWQKKTGAGDWVAIDGATALTYVVATPVAVDDVIRCVVTATNGVNRVVTAASNTTAAVIAA